MRNTAKNLIAKNEYGLYSIPEEVSYTYTAQFILDGGVHEDTTIEYLQSIGGNIIHAGSGFGDFLPALKNCNKVWVFEPNTLMYESSLETISLNNLVNVEIFPFALGRYDGTANLKHIDERGLEMGPRSEMNDSGIKVKMVKMDSMIPKDTKISLIHLDLEGYEFAALNGAKEIIERDKPILVLEIDTRAVLYNDFMLSINYVPHKQLIFNSNERMVFVNTVYIHKDKEVKKDYWASELPLPLSPSDSDVDIYKDNMIEGSTLMLGCTKKLIPISNIQMDIDPWYEAKTVIKGDWLDNKTYYGNIIADGSLSFTKELADGLIEMASKHCKVFIARTFTKRLPIMRIADNFPQPEDFKIPPTKTVEFEDYSFYIWQF
jgi:FkbM family methyltransferase